MGFCKFKVMLWVCMDLKIIYFTHKLKYQADPKHQNLKLLVSFLFCFSTAFKEVGGYNALLERYSKALPLISLSPDLQHLNISKHCYTPREDAFHLLRDPVTGDLPWPGVLFGIAIVGGWYWCTDQVRCTKITVYFINKMIFYFIRQEHTVPNLPKLGP